MNSLSGFGILLAIIGIGIMIYDLSLLGEADYLTTRGGFAIGMIITILGGVLAILPTRK